MIKTQKKDLRVVFRDLFMTQEEKVKLSNYDKINNNLIKEQKLTDIQVNEINSLTNSFNEEQELRIKAEEKYKTLIQSKHLDINKLKDWYENRRIQKSWKYDGGRLGYVDVKKYLIPSNMSLFTKQAKAIINKYGLTPNHKPVDIIDKMYKYWNLKSSWTYSTDEKEFGHLDWWEDPTTAMIKRKGDCESKSHCMYNTALEMFRILDMKDSEWRLTFIAATLVGYSGHGFLTWLHDDGEYYVVESTYDQISSKSKTWLHTPMRFNNLYKTPWGFATKEKSWVGSNSALLKFEQP